MEVIVNYKHLESGYNVIQLESAVGAAMKCFNGAIGVNVPRSRFLPVKKTSDLMLVMSNLYNLKNGSLIMSPQRMFPTTPLVKLGDEHFSKVGIIPILIFTIKIISLISFPQNVRVNKTMDGVTG